jgi:DNA-binding transcriptional MocR family regulator
METVLTLSDAQLVQLAERLAENLRGKQPPATRLVDASELAKALGVSRETVYEYAAALGARRIGEGPRGRLRFDLNAALEAWTHRSVREGSAARESPARAGNAPARGRRRKGSGEQLLPIRGPIPITTPPERQ